MPKKTFFNLSKEKKSRIMQASLSEFSQREYRDSNLDRIAGSAGIPKGSLYQYFENKEEMFIYTALWSIQQVYARFEQYLDENPAKDCYDLFAKALLFSVRMHRYDPDAAGLYHRVGFLQNTPLREKIVGDIHQKNDLFMEKFFSIGFKTGQIDTKIDIPAARFVLDSISNRFQEEVYRSRDKNSDLLQSLGENDEQCVDRLVAMLKKTFSAEKTQDKRR